MYVYGSDYAPMAPVSATSTSVGVLEFGRSSVKLAFLPERHLVSNTRTLILNGNHYRLYADSYVDYGLDNIEQWIVDYLIEIPVDNPCWPHGRRLSMFSNYALIRPLHNE